MSEQRSIRRILVIRFSALGDILLTLPALHLLREQSGVEIHYLTKENFVEVVKMSGAADQVHSISSHATLSELKLKIIDLNVLGFDTVLDLHNNIRSRIVSSKLKSGRTRVLRITKHRILEALLFIFRARMFQNFFETNRLSRLRESLSLVAQAMGGAEKAQNSEKATLQYLPELSSDLLSKLPDRSGKTVCVSMESAWKQKEWEATKFRSLIERMAKRGFNIVLLGTQRKDFDLPKGVIDFRGMTNIGQAAAVLKNAKLLICNDSGLMHLAEAVGTPVVGIFGPTSREVGFSPRLQQSVMAEAALWCRPCSKTGRLCFRLTDRRKCLRLVEVQEVERRAVEVLELRHENMDL